MNKLYQCLKKISLKTKHARFFKKNNLKIMLNKWTKLD